MVIPIGVQDLNFFWGESQHRDDAAAGDELSEAERTTLNCAEGLMQLSWGASAVVAGGVHFWEPILMLNDKYQGLRTGPLVSASAASIPRRALVRPGRR